MADGPPVKGIGAGPVQNIRTEQRMNSDPYKAHFGLYSYSQKGEFCRYPRVSQFFLFFLCTRAR